MTMLVSVEAPHFHAGIVIEDGVCVRAAPILRWAVGKARDVLSAHFRETRWKATIVRPDRRPELDPLVAEVLDRFPGAKITAIRAGGPHR